MITDFDLDCPNCGSRVIACLPEPEDGNVTCSCGYGIPVGEARRAEAEFAERQNEIMEIHSEIVAGFNCITQDEGVKHEQN